MSRLYPWQQKFTGIWIIEKDYVYHVKIKIGRKIFRAEDKDLELALGKIKSQYRKWQCKVVEEADIIGRNLDNLVIRVLQEFADKKIMVRPDSLR